MHNIICCVSNKEKCKTCSFLFSVLSQHRSERMEREKWSRSFSALLKSLMYEALRRCKTLKEAAMNCRRDGKQETKVELISLFLLKPCAFDELQTTPTLSSFWYFRRGVFGALNLNKWKMKVLFHHLARSWNSWKQTSKQDRKLNNLISCGSRATFYPSSKKLTTQRIKK